MGRWSAMNLAYTHSHSCSIELTFGSMLRILEHRGADASLDYTAIAAVLFLRYIVSVLTTEDSQL